MAMTPLDDPALSGLGALAKARPGRVAGIPTQAVEALRGDFGQALRDAGAHQERYPHSPDSPPEEPQEEEAPALAFAPPEVYDPHGKLPSPADRPRLNLEG